MPGLKANISETYCYPIIWVCVVRNCQLVDKYTRRRAYIYNIRVYKIYIKGRVIINTVRLFFILFSGEHNDIL